MEDQQPRYQEEHWYGFHLIHGRVDPETRSQQEIEILDLDKQRRILEMEHDLREIQDIEQARRAIGKKKLPNGVMPKFATKYGLSAQGAWAMYKQFQRIGGHVRDRRGRPKEQRLTIKQQKELIGLYLIKDYFRYLVDGTSQKPHTTHSTVTIAFVVSAMFATFPELEHAAWFTPEYVMRYLKQKERESPGPFVLARQGDSELHNMLLPKLPNDVNELFERIQSDGRYLPFYVRHKGIVCTVVIVIFLDDFSNYVPAWLIRPRKEPNGTAKPHTIDFSSNDVNLLLAELLRRTGLRPRLIYTDNGSQFVALRKVLPLLTIDAAHPIDLILSEPGKPQGRGKVEAFLKLLNAAICQLGGFVENERDLKCWSDARNHPDLLDLAELRKQIDATIKKLNTTVRDGETLTPFEKWRTSPGPRYSAPPVNRLAHLLAKVDEEKQSISDDGIQYNHGTRSTTPRYFVPKDTSVAADQRWLAAAGREEKVAFQVHHMQEFGTFYYASLDQTSWEELILDKDHGRSLAKRMKNRQTVLTEVRQNVKGIRDEITQSQTDIHGMLPQYDPVNETAVYTKPVRRTSRVQNEKSQENDLREDLGKDDAGAAEEVSSTTKQETLAKVTQSALSTAGEEDSGSETSPILVPEQSIEAEEEDIQALMDMYEQLLQKHKSA
jgi:transposase InsO family protein